jgi:DHA1 family inner membrane transport protein
VVSEHAQYESITQLRASPILVLLLLSGVMFLARTISLMLAPLLIALAAEFQTTAALAGQLAAATYITWGIVAPLVGPISDTYGRRPVALMGLLLMGGGILGSVMAWNYASLLICRLLTGVGGAMAPPNSMAAISDHFPPAQRGTAVGWLFSASWLGAVIGVPLVGLLADVGGWRFPFYVLAGLIGLVWGCLWLWFPRHQLPATPRLDFAGRFQELSRTPGVWAVLVTNVLQQMTFFAMFTYLAAYLVQAYRMPTGETALALALVGGGAMAGSLLGGRIAGHPRRLRVLAVSLLGSGMIAGVSFIVSTSAWIIVASASMVSILASIGAPVLMTLMTELAGRSRATGIGMFGASNQLGGVGGVLLGGVALSLGGFALIGLLCLGAATVAAAVVRWQVRDSAEFRQRMALPAGNRVAT